MDTIDEVCGIPEESVCDEFVLWIQLVQYWPYHERVLRSEDHHLIVRTGNCLQKLVDAWTLFEPGGEELTLTIRWLAVVIGSPKWRIKNDGCRFLNFKSL